MDNKALAADLKAIHGVDTLEIAEVNLEQFDEVGGVNTRIWSSLGAVIGRA